MKYFSMCSGVGGIELGIERALDNKYVAQKQQDREGRNRNSDEQGVQLCSSTITPLCVGYSEIDKYAIATYEKHFGGHKNYGDATKIKPEELPDFDLLVGGFPCQAFSIAGKRRGFEDTRGTLFFEIARVLKVKQPRMFLLENVKGLLNHNGGETFTTILKTIDELGYDAEWQVLNSKHFGVPQNRERVFIIGHKRQNEKVYKQPQIFPLISNKKEIYDEITKDEKVFLLSKRTAEYIQILLSEKTKGQDLSREQMQGLFEEIQSRIQKEECEEIEGEQQKIRQDSKGILQEVKDIDSWSQSQDNTRGICAVVQIPTESVLLLWSQTGESSISFRQIQQQDLSFECGQNRLIKRIREGKLGSLLFAVQPYKGRLFYSIGDGRNWQKIYTQEVEGLCNPSLSYILEEQVESKYFLSDKQVKSLTSGLQASNILDIQEETTKE